MIKVLFSNTVKLPDSGVGNRTFRKYRIRIAAILGLSLSMAAITPTMAFAMDTYSLGEKYVFETCLLARTPGTFYLQAKASGSSKWINQAKGTLFDASRYENDCRTPYAVDVWWTPKKAGVFSIRIFNSSTGNSYKKRTIRVSGNSLNNGGSGNPQVQYVTMPNLLGMTVYQANTQISSFGYRLGSWALPRSTGFAPLTSCLMDRSMIVVKQSPAPGMQVVNSYSTFVSVWVNCG